MKRILFAAAFSVLTFCALVVVVYFTFGAGSKPKPQPLQLVGPNGVTVKPIVGCTDELPWAEPHKIKSVTRTGDELKVNVLVNASCGPGTASKPVATRFPDRIELTWSWWRDPNELVAGCLCTHAFEFTIPGVEGKMPKVVLVP